MFADGDAWLHGPLVAARSISVGAACQGGNGPPLLATGVPHLGNQGMRLDLQSGLANSACLFALAVRPANQSIGGGCTLYVDLASPAIFLAAATNARGFGSSPLPLPLDITLRGGSLHAQGIVLDPMGPVLGVALTAGRTLLLGD
jgi:hypothetical protein